MTFGTADRAISCCTNLSRLTHCATSSAVGAVMVRIYACFFALDLALGTFGFDAFAFITEVLLRAISGFCGEHKAAPAVF